MTAAPTLTTPRLTLRAPVMGDFAAYAAFLAGPRSGGVDGPLDTKGAWGYFTSDVALWSLKGVGGFMMQLKDGGAVVGLIAVNVGPLFAEPELGWMVYDGHQGQGFALEGASVVRDWAMGQPVITSLVSYVGRDNAPSRRLAERLGAVVDADAASPGAETLVYRHKKGAMQ
jgi:RimJ/RimL family protein N-acetyltransferase